MAIRRCLACGDAFPLRSQTPQQAYCSNKACQRERRKLWQRERRQADNDYRENQAQAQRRWQAAHPDYWRRYRHDHPDYAQRNRDQQQRRNAERDNRPVPVIAKMDASGPALPVQTGLYLLSGMQDNSIAKMDAWIVEITFLAAT